MKQIEVVARSEKQALEKAAALLNVPASEVEIIEEYEPDEIDLQNLSKEEETTGVPADAAEPVLYVVQMSMRRPLESAREWIQGLIDRFQPGSTVRVEVSEGVLRATIEAPDPSIFIGKQGHTLAALQHLITRVVPRKIENCPPVQVDVGDYRDRKQEQLERLVESAVRRAIKTRRNVSLRPMPSTDRKFIHNYLKERKGITTVSYGQEPRRYVAIEVPGGDRPGSGDRDRGRRGGGRGERGGGRDRQYGDRGHGRKQYGDGDRQYDRTYAGDRHLEERDRQSLGNRELPPQSTPRRDGNRYERSGNRREKFDRQPNFNRDGVADQKPHQFEDVDIDERPSRLLNYNEKAVDEALMNPERPFVDELIDELEQ